MELIGEFWHQNVSFFLAQSMTLKEALKEALVVLKQIMEEKLNATNVEVSYAMDFISLHSLVKMIKK